MAYNRLSWLNNNNKPNRHHTNPNFDPEKQPRVSSDDDEEAPSLVSSDSMLSQYPSRPKNYALRYHVPRRRFTRIFTCSIATVLILLALYLVGSSRLNEAELRLGLKKPPEPQIPHAWEHFPLLKRYYGGIRTLVSKEENIPEFPPGPVDEELRRKAWSQKYEEDVVSPPTFGGFEKRDESGESEMGRRDVSRGVRFDPYAEEEDDDTEWEYEKKVPCSVFPTKNRDEGIPQLLAYNGVPKGFPEPAYGSHELFGLRNDICFERYGRLGPYGFGYSRNYGGSGAGLEGEKEGSEDVWGDQLEVDYREVKWADAQLECMVANEHRFRPAKVESDRFFGSLGSGSSDAADSAVDEDKDKATSEMTGPDGKKLVPRTAFVIRTWKEYNYDPEDLFYLRALVNELSLQSGTEYVVHFLIHVKNNDNPIWASTEAYDKALSEALPTEFQGMGTLWSEKQMELIYPGLHDSHYRNLPVYGVYRSTYLPLQYFAHQHPQYDFFWHWEMDARYTGHFRELFEKVSAWAKQQPRKGLWERNARFYVPDVHGSWDNFTKFVEEQIENAAAAAAADADGWEKSIWGPYRPKGNTPDQLLDTAYPENDPKPPTTYEEDDYEWGVGEEADFVTFNPLFDPHLTNWILAEDVTGYDTRSGFPPRRIAIITASRLSRRLLNTMHAETVQKKHTMFSEMWPGSCALHHGLKAVYAPHPVYVDRAWPTDFLAATFNNGKDGASGGSRLSTFSDERQHNFIGTTWYYHAEFAGRLWKRWLGYKVKGEGGEEFEMTEVGGDGPGGEGAKKEGQGEGRMCLPGMLLHPVKQVDLVYEHQAGE